MQHIGHKLLIAIMAMADVSILISDFAIVWKVFYTIGTGIVLAMNFLLAYKKVRMDFRHWWIIKTFEQCLPKNWRHK